MATDVTDGRAFEVTSRRTHRRRGFILVAISLFQFWLWGTRIFNLLTSDEQFTPAFVAVHMLLYTVAIAAGIVLLVMGARMLREAASAARR